MKKLKSKKAITLVALVVTIVVLLILAGVSIATLTGDNGLLTKAGDAKEQTEIGEEKEGIGLATMDAQMANNGDSELNQSNLQSAIDKQFGNGKAIVIDNGDGTFTVRFNNTLREYDVTSNGIENGINWTEKMEKADAQTINGKTVYAIDLNGDDVDMNYWEYCYDIQTNGYALNDETVLNNSEYGGSATERIRNKGYLGNYTSDGKIIEKVPMFIKENDGWKPVTSMYNTFYSCTELKIAPEIPSTVTCMWSTFQSCGNLTVGQIGNNANNIRNCFMDCTSLVTSPKMPNSVENIAMTFYRCTSLNNITNFSDKINNMSSTFQDCSALKKVPKLPNNVENMQTTFFGCTSIIEAPEIPNKVKNMKKTFYGCTNLVTPPSEIPNSVINIMFTFYKCNLLSGNMVINANITDEIKNTTENGFTVGKTSYDGCFSGGCSEHSIGLTLTTTNSKLKENNYDILNKILNTKYSNSNIFINK